MNRRVFLGWTGATVLVATAAARPCPPNNPHCGPPTTTMPATTTTTLGSPGGGYAAGYDPGY